MSELAKNLVLILLRGYKWALSPMFPPSCRYVPTCSEYAAEAVERHGALRGLALAVRRLFRCHPFAMGGFDPVPLFSGAPHATLFVAPDDEAAISKFHA